MKEAFRTCDRLRAHLLALSLGAGLLCAEPSENITLKRVNADVHRFQLPCFALDRTRSGMGGVPSNDGLGGPWTIGLGLMVLELIVEEA